MSRVRAALRLALLPGLVTLAVAVAWRAGYFDLARGDQLIALVRQAEHTSWAWVIYLIAYTLIATLGIPVTVLSIVGGALFGASRGLVLGWAGAMAGTLTGYGLARSVGGPAVRQFLGAHHLLDHLRKRSDFWTLVRLRVLPVAPFALLNYAAGLLGVSLRRLMLATAVGILPTTAAYSYAGAQLVIGLERGGVARSRALWIAGAVTLLVICISLVPTAIRQLRS
jgi:uncharacterized membrane protein YdjX (TVP38/TMEM64 family)